MKTAPSNELEVWEEFHRDEVILKERQRQERGKPAKPHRDDEMTDDVVIGEPQDVEDEVPKEEGEEETVAMESPLEEEAADPEPMSPLDASPALEEPEPERQPSLGVASDLHTQQKLKDEKEQKNASIKTGQAELAKIMSEIETKKAKKRQAASEASLKREMESAYISNTPSSERTMGESWNLVCDLIDFKRDHKSDLSAFKSLLIQLKHV